MTARPDMSGWDLYFNDDGSVTQFDGYSFEEIPDLDWRTSPDLYDRARRERAAESTEDR